MRDNDCMNTHTLTCCATWGFDSSNMAHFGCFCFPIEWIFFLIVASRHAYRCGYYIGNHMHLVEAQPVQDWRHRATKASLKSCSWSVKGSKWQLVRLLAMTYDDYIVHGDGENWYHYFSWQEFRLSWRRILILLTLLPAGENRTPCLGKRNISLGFMFFEIILGSTYQ